MCPDRKLHDADGVLMNNTSNLTEYQYDATYSLPVIKAETIATDVQSTEKFPIYMYESDVQNNNTYFIIQGTYDNKEYYYKMSLLNSSLQAMDIVRNHSYTFTIHKAKGPGYDTVSDAKIAKAV